MNISFFLSFFFLKIIIATKILQFIIWFRLIPFRIIILGDKSILQWIYRF